MSDVNKQIANIPVVLPEPDFLQRHEDVCGDEVGPPTAFYTADTVRALLATGGKAQAVEVLGWVHKTKRGKIGNHFYTYEPHCDTAVRDDGGEKIAVIAASGAAPQAQAVERDALTPAARDVLAERARQVSVEGWTPERDDQYTDCQLAAAAASCAVCGKDPKALKLMGVTAWPWRDYWWKPETYRRNLEKAGALILAEIERIDRQPSRA